MISLFETIQEEAPTFRDIYLKRLHEIAYAPNGRLSDTPTASATDPTVKAPPPETDSVAAVAITEIETTPKSPWTSPFPAAEPISLRGEMKAEARLEAMTVDSRKLAEEISPKFVDAFVAAFEELGRQASGSNAEVSKLAAELSRVSEQLQALSGQMEAYRRLIDSLGAAQRELFTRVSTIDSALREHAKVLVNLEAESKQFEQSSRAQQDTLMKKLDDTAAQAAQINERLDVQANAIRTLHGGTRDREDQRDELRSTLLKIQEIAGKLSTPGPLPDRL